MHDGHFLKTSCGSPNYAAPEVLSGKLYSGPEVDVWSCGVILYALLCASLPFDDGNLSSLYKKIKRGMYILPSHLSPGARDLIARMLVVDPMKRITIPKIRQHSWFLIHLPRYLTVPAPETFQQGIKIDEDVLQEVVTMGVERNQLIDSLQNRIQNQGVVAYNLMLDKYLHLFNGYLGAEMPDRNEIIPHASTGGPALPILGYGLPSYIDQGDPIGHGLILETKWALGLQSKAHPQDIMKEVLKLLQTLNIGWKIIDHYAMKCRWFPQFLSPIDPQCSNRELLQNGIDDKSASTAKIGNGINESQNNVVKFEVQLFKTNEEKYLLDLQRVQGPHFLFLDLCAVFLSQLQVF